MSGQTFFSRESCLYPDITEDRRIPATPFLTASTLLLPFFDDLGTGFGIVKNDVSGNIEKLKKKQAMNPKAFLTINDMLEDEVENPKEDLAQIAGLWLKRGLDFLCSFFEVLIQNKDNPSESTHPYLSEAYAKTLKPYHGFILTKVFAGLSRMIAYKTPLLSKMKVDKTVEDSLVFEDLEKFNKLLRANVDALDECLKKLNFDSDKKV